MAKEQPSINLLHNGESLTDQILTWALAVGRLLVIVTETIALATFLYRFSIDRRLVDLHDEIKKNQTLVQYFKTNEGTYRQLQQKLSISKKQDATTEKLITMFKDIMQLGDDSGITFENLTVNTTGFEITIQAGTIDSINTFFDALKKYPSLTSLNVDKVENKASSAMVVVSMTATIKSDTPTTNAPKKL